jgi:hypothetical protein
MENKKIGGAQGYARTARAFCGRCSENVTVGYGNRREKEHIRQRLYTIL